MPPPSFGPADAGRAATQASHPEKQRDVVVARPKQCQGGCSVQPGHMLSSRRLWPAPGGGPDTDDSTAVRRRGDSMVLATRSAATSRSGMFRFCDTVRSMSNAICGATPLHPDDDADRLIDHRPGRQRGPQMIGQGGLVVVPQRRGDRSPRPTPASCAAVDLGVLVERVDASGCTGSTRRSGGRRRTAGWTCTDRTPWATARAGYPSHRVSVVRSSQRTTLPVRIACRHGPDVELVLLLVQQPGQPVRRRHRDHMAVLGQRDPAGRRGRHRTRRTDRQPPASDPRTRTSPSAAPPAPSTPQGSVQHRTQPSIGHRSRCATT